jgi:2-keto-3-deoxy-L-rhamnonate aldolase RhmA
MSSGNWQNPIRTKLAAGGPVYAATIVSNSVETAAHAATLGFDFLWMEMEHSPVTLETLRHVVLACRALPAQVFARVPVNDLWTAKRVLDQGVTGVMFPFTSTPELARQAADACHYPPRGRRGSGAGLAMASWPDPTAVYYDSADANVFVIAIVEERRAVEQIDQVAATPGIDALFIGTSDLSFSYGLRGKQDDPALLAAIERIVDAGQRNGKFLGRPAAGPEKVRQFRDQGFQLFQLPTDLGLMTLGAKSLLEPLGIVPPPRKALY